MSMAGAAVMAHRGAGRPTMPLSHHALDASSFPAAPIQRSSRPAVTQAQHQLSTTVAASVAAQGARSAAPTPRSVSSGHPSPRSNAPDLVISGARYEPSTAESDTRHMRPAVAAVQHAPRSAAPQALLTDSRDRMQIDTAPSPSVTIHAGVSAIRALIDNFRHAPAMDPQERKESINANMLWWTKPSAHAPISPPARVVSPRAVASRLGSPTRLASSSSTELYNAEVARSNRVRSPNFQRQQRHSVESKSSAQDSVTPQSPQPALRASGIRTSIDVPLATANTALSPPPRRALTPGSGPAMPPLRLKALNDVAKADASLAASLVAGLKQKPSVESSAVKSSHPHPLELTGGLHVDALQRISADEFAHHDQFDIIPDVHNDSDEGVCLVDADMSDSGVRDSIDDEDVALLADLQATRDEVRAEMQQQRTSQSTFKEGSLSETMMHDALALLQGPPSQSVSEPVETESAPVSDGQPGSAVSEKPRRPSLFELAQQERLQQEQTVTQPSSDNVDASPDQDDVDFPVFTLRKSALPESNSCAEDVVEPVVESESVPALASVASIPESVPQSAPVSEVVEDKSALTGIPGSLRHLPASVIDPLYLTTRNFEPTLSPIQSVALSSSSQPASTAPAATPSEHVDVARSQSLWDMSTSDVHDLDAARSVPTTPVFAHAPAGVGASVDISASLNASLASLGTAKSSEVQNKVEEKPEVKTEVAPASSTESQVPNVPHDVPMVAPADSAPAVQPQTPADAVKSSSATQPPTVPSVNASTSVSPPADNATVDNFPAAEIKIPVSTPSVAPAEPSLKEQPSQPTVSVPTTTTQPASQSAPIIPVPQSVPQTQAAQIPQPAPTATVPPPALPAAVPPTSAQTTTLTQPAPAETIAPPVVSVLPVPSVPEAKPVVPAVVASKPENKPDTAPAAPLASVATPPVQPSEQKLSAATLAAPRPVAAKVESAPKPTTVPQPSITSPPSTDAINAAPVSKSAAPAVQPSAADVKPAAVEPRVSTPLVASQSPRPVTSVNTGLEAERAALQRDIERLRAELSAVTAATSAATSAAAAATAAAAAATSAANQVSAAQKPPIQNGEELDVVQALSRVADNVAKKTALDMPPVVTEQPVGQPVAEIAESNPTVLSQPDPVPVVPSITLPVIPVPQIPTPFTNSNIASPIVSPFVSPRSVALSQGAPSTALNTARTAFTDQLSIAPSVISTKLPARVDLSRGSNVPLNLRRAVLAASNKPADKNVEMETLVSSVAKLADSIAALTTMLQPSEKELPTHSALVQPAGAQPSRVESPVSHTSDYVESPKSASPLSPAKLDEHRLPHSRSIQTLAPALCVAHTQTDPVPVSPERSPVSAPAPSAPASSASNPAASLPPASMASAVIPGFDVWGTAMQSLQQQLQLQIQLQQLQLQNQLNNNLAKPVAVDAVPARSNSPPSRKPSVDKVSAVPPTPPSTAPVPVPEFEWPSLPPPDYFDQPPIAPPAYSPSRDVSEDEPNDFPANGRRYRVPYPLLTSLRLAPPSSHPSPRSVIDSILKVSAQPIVVQSYQPVAAPAQSPQPAAPACAITPMQTKPRDLSRSVSIAASVPAKPLIPSASSASLKAAQAASMLSDDESDDSPLLKPSSSTSSLISPVVPIKNNPTSAISTKSNALAAAALLGSDDDDLLDLAG